MRAIDLLRDLLLLSVALIAAVSDVRTRRIPSKVTVPAIFAGVLLRALQTTPRELAWVIATVVVTFVVGFVLFAAGILGGGDGKLLTAVAALCGPLMFREFIVWTLISGVVMAITLLAWRGALIPLFRRAGIAVADLVRFGTTAQPLVEGEPHRMPYAVVIFVAALVTVLAARAGVVILG